MLTSFNHMMIFVLTVPPKGATKAQPTSFNHIQIPERKR